MTVSKIGDARVRQWRKDLICKGDGGEPKRLLANVLHVMTAHPAWANVLAFDEFMFTLSKRSPPPTRPQDGASEVGEWTETDTSRTRAWFATEVGFEPSASDVEQAVDAVARRNSYHPVRAYLSALSWDGVPRLDGLLSTYFGARPTPYTQCVGPRWMISAVARVMRPGCQVDCMIVLEGEQGIRKSTGLAELFSPAWFGESNVAIGDKDGYQALRGKWCFEFGELSSIKSREVERVKSFVSARIDTYRPSYGRRTIDVPRQCVFAGTTNESEYLADQTGNRRFWPVRCDVVNFALLRADRDQLWAEARAQFDAGEPWYVDSPELNALCKQEQAEREIEDPWISKVARWLRSEAEKGNDPAGRGVTTENVLSGALNLRDAELSRAASTRVGGVLRKLGWEPKQLRRDGGAPRLYFPTSRPSLLSQPPANDTL